jgi:DNA-directed RNA polymerase subunit RPC12/RpoP
VAAVRFVYRAMKSKEEEERRPEATSRSTHLKLSVLADMTEVGNRPAVVCKGCGKAFPISARALPSRSVERLPDPFLARCPRCGSQATYPKTAIHILDGTGP